MVFLSIHPQESFSLHVDSVCGAISSHFCQRHLLSALPALLDITTNVRIF